MKNFFERVEEGFSAKEMVVFAAGRQTGKTMLTTELLESYLKELKQQREEAANADMTQEGLKDD